MTFVNQEQAEHWATVGPIWVENEDEIETVTGVPGRLAMDRLDLQPGQHVLDLGCGTGRTTLALASRVAPNGRARGVDIAKDMLTRARQHADDAGVQNVDFVQADVQAQTLGEADFDAAYSRFGVMFFSDPVVAFGSVHRSLRRPGWLSFVCWQPLAVNDWMLVPGQTVAAVLDTTLTTPASDEPGPFSLADPERLRAILSSAGFRDVDIQPHNDFVVTPEERIPLAATTATRVGRTRDLLKDASPSVLDRARTAIEGAFRERLHGGEVQLSRGILLVVARA